MAGGTISPGEGEFVQCVVLLTGKLESVFQISIAGLQVADGHHLLVNECLIGGDDAMDEVGIGCGGGGGFGRRSFRFSDGCVF